jgi:hypothetical protein
MLQPMGRAANPHAGMRTRSSVLVMALASVVVLTFAGCGESKEEKAKKTACAARTDIKAKAEHLSTITPSSASVSEVENDLKAIGDDLTKIKNAQGDLSPARKREVEKATNEFATVAGANLSSILTGLAKGEVTPQLKSAFEQLLTAYKQALGPIKC